MIHTKDHNQLSFIDPWEHLGPKRRKLLDESWAGIFQKEILPTLPVHKFSRHFCGNNGRSTKELSSVLGVILIQQVLDETDAATIHQFAFNQQWHYALNIWEESDEAAYIRVLRKNRQTLIIPCFKRKNLYNGIMIPINII